MKAAHCIALLCLDIAVSAIPTYYGYKDDLIRIARKQEPWPCNDMKPNAWNTIPLSKTNTEAVINSMFKIAKPPCNHRHAMKDMKLPDITQKPEEAAPATQYLGTLPNVVNRNGSMSQDPVKPLLTAAATLNNPPALGYRGFEDNHKVATFTNIINTKIATPRLAHLLPLWIPQRKYFNVRREENLILRNQRSNNLHKDRKLNSNLQFSIQHGPKDFFSGDNFNVQNKMTGSSVWNRFSPSNTAEEKKESEKLKRQIRGSNKDTPKKFYLAKKELHKGGKFRKGHEAPYALFYRIPQDGNKSKDLLRYLSEPSTAIYGPYLATLTGSGGELIRKRMNNVKDIYTS